MLKPSELSEKEFELKMRNAILSVPEEVRDRFIAMCLNSDQLAAIVKEHEKAVKEIEIKYEKLYEPIYKERAEIIAGKQAPSEENIQKFNQKDQEIKDEEYEKL